MAKKKPEKKKKLAPAKKPLAAVKKVLGHAAKQVAKKVGVSAKAPAVSAKAKKPAPAPKKAEKPAKPVITAKAAKVVAVKGKASVVSKAAPIAKVAAKAAVVNTKDKKAKAPKEKDTVVEVLVNKKVAANGKAAASGKKAANAAHLSVVSKRRCREPGCDNDHILSGFCRLHYIKNWRKIKRKEAILATGQLNNYVEELVNKYPDKYLDVIRQDLASEKDWSKVVVDLELESGEDESGAEEDIDAVAEGVRSGAGRADRDFDDEGDAF